MEEERERNKEKRKRKREIEDSRKESIEWNSLLSTPETGY